MRKFGIATLCLWLGACQGRSSRDDRAQPSAALREAAEEIGADWVFPGSNDERLVRLASQFRGWDVTMVEVGYRYSMLYWAGSDGNWAFGNYQINKLKETVRFGVERRPDYSGPVRVLDGALSSVTAALDAHDPKQFRQRVEELTAACNACHQATEHPWIRIRPPTVRVSPASQVPDYGSQP